jgi:hypothetical protein
MVLNVIETIVNLLSPDKRTPNTIAFLSPPANQLQVDFNTLQDIYKVGTNYNTFDFNATYSRYDIVKYGKAVYYSAINNNINNFPTNSDDWVLVTTNFIGTDSRLYFNGTKIVFEYAINTYFQTVYNPDTTQNSEIYVETIAPRRKAFTIGLSEIASDALLDTSSTGFIRQTDNVDPTYNLIIWVKDLGQVGKATQDEIKNFADRYIVAGVKYIIQNY